MSGGIGIVLLLIFVVVAYTIAQVRAYMRQSERQWQQVDKSKLREWQDDDC